MLLVSECNLMGLRLTQRNDTSPDLLIRSSRVAANITSA